jgi:hypothetical protein
MARTAVTQLQQQIEKLRREGFAGRLRRGDLLPVRRRLRGPSTTARA